MLFVFEKGKRSAIVVARSLAEARAACPGFDCKQQVRQTQAGWPLPCGSRLLAWEVVTDASPSAPEVIYL